jgi:hypothetical protein
MMGQEDITVAHELIPRYPKNALGDFYVEHNCCLTCEAPSNEAHDLMAHDDEGDYPHCYFKRQPETPEEVERAVMACFVSCVRAVRYAGKNPKILKRLQEIGRGDSCDLLSPGDDDTSLRTLREKLERLRGVEDQPRSVPTSPAQHLLYDPDLDS